MLSQADSAGHDDCNGEGSMAIGAIGAELKRVAVEDQHSALVRWKANAGNSCGGARPDLRGLSCQDGTPSGSEEEGYDHGRNEQGDNSGRNPVADASGIATLSGARSANGTSERW